MTDDIAHIPRGDELLHQVLAGDRHASGIANALLNEFFRGYPIERLTALFQSDNQQAVQSGAWIASELPDKAGAILSDLAPLLDYPDVRVKYHAIETILTAATERDGEIIAHALSLISSPDSPVRRASFQLLARTDARALSAAAPYVVDQQVAEQIKWVLDLEAESQPDDEIVARLQGDELRRLFAAVAAARVYPRNPHYLQFAASSLSGEEQSLAASELARLSGSRGATLAP